MKKGAWWKILAVLILLAVIASGMLIPLSPGLQSVSPNSVSAGEEARLEITGYNFEFTEESQTYLKLGDGLLRAKEDHVDGGNTLFADFLLPSNPPIEEEYTSLSLFVVDTYGTAVLPASISYKTQSEDYPENSESWDAQVRMKENKGITFPYRNILQETIRNQYFHVPMWFSMILMFAISLYYSIIGLRGGNDVNSERRVVALNRVGLLFGILGIVTGAIWANYTWGSPWSGDIKQNMAAICLLIYAAYFVLRASIEDRDRKRRISHAYNIFAFVMIIPLLFIIPRMTASLHPGSGGNPGFSSYDLDSTMRMVFYPAVIGWTLLGLWLSQLWYRMKKVNEFFLEKYRSIK